MLWWLFLVAVQPDEPSDVRADDVVAAVEARQQRIEDIELQMRVETSTLPVAGAPSDAGIPPEGIVRHCTVHYRSRGDWYYYRLDERSEPDHRDYDYIWSFDGERVYHFSPRDWGGFIRGPEGAAHPDIVEPYLTACGIMPSFRPDTRRWAWITTLRDRISVCPTVLEGRPVIRAEAPEVAAWYLDPARNLAPIQVVVLSEGAEGLTINSEFIDAGCGVFLPLKVTRNSSNGRLRSEWYFDVTLAKVNQGLTVRDFRIQFPANADIADMTGKASVVRRAPRDAEALLTELVEYARRDGMVLGRRAALAAVAASDETTQAPAAQGPFKSGKLACGPCAAFVALNCLGVPACYADLARRLSLNSDGATNFERLRDLMRAEHVDAALRVIGTAELAELRAPAILGFREGSGAALHFVAFTGRKADRYCVIDAQGRFPVLPARGDWLARRWDGSALLLGADARARLPAPTRSDSARRGAAIAVAGAGLGWLVVRQWRLHDRRA